MVVGKRAMPLISYEAAQRFRENANAPLTWDEAIPAPPLDRIEFPRRIVEAADAAGLEFPVWDAPLPDNSDEKLMAFQNTMYQTMPRQSFRLWPAEKKRWYHAEVPRRENPRSWGEYIERLENDYFIPWKTSWLFGACEGGQANVLFLLQEIIGRYANLNHSKESINQIKESDIIARHLMADEGHTLYFTLLNQTGAGVMLVEERWLGIREPWPHFDEHLLFLAALGTAVWVAWMRHFSFWWLFLLVPLAFVAFNVVFIALSFVTMALMPRLTNQKKWYWIDETVTCGELANRIVTTKKEEWDYLQTAYRVN